MRVTSIICLALFLVSVHCDSPFFKLFSQPTPIYRGRADPIVAPGGISQHSHRVFGASGFSYGIGRSNTQMYDDLRASTCTTMDISEDKTNYWVPDLYYQWRNGSLSLVPGGGLTVYYMGRAGSGSQANPVYQPFPRGFRMLAGNPFKRNYTGTIPEQAVTWACLGAKGMPETPGFNTTYQPCINGLRAQVFFPQCWNGVDLDSPNHQDHVAYPVDGYNTGNCPSTHPYRFMSVFYEVLFNVDPTIFPHGNGGTNPFVLAPGDPTGYGYHGDFLNGWNTQVFAAALTDPTCFSASTNNGNAKQYCNALSPYLKTNNPDGSCFLDTPLLNYEDLGYNHVISHLPGNNAISYGPGQEKPCFGVYPQTLAPGFFRVLLKAVKNGLYVNTRVFTDPLCANITQSQIWYPQVFNFAPIGGGLYAISTEIYGRYVSSNNGGTSPLTADRYNPSGWETWSIVFSGGSAPSASGTLGSLKASNGNYVTLNAMNQLVASSTTIGPNEQFYFIDANAAVTDTRSC